MINENKVKLMAKIQIFEDKENELEELKNAKDKNLKFTEIWTLKESYLKLKGLGIYMDLKNVLSKKDYCFKYFYVGEYVICECINI